jgi:hypothetical protein
MKIIGSSNYDKETVNDILVADHITDERDGKIMTDALNANASNYSHYFYSLMPDDYVLYKWEP